MKDDITEFIRFVRAVHKNIAETSLSASYIGGGVLNLLVFVFLSLILLVFGGGVAFLAQATGLNFLFLLGGVFALAALTLPVFADPLQDGITAYQAKNYKSALEKFKNAAATGNIQAAYNVGIMYDRGLGVTKNDMEANKWYRLVAEAGIKEAQYALGINYFFGSDTLEKNYPEAVKWLRKAADQGYPKAQFRMGNIYDDGGFGVEGSKATAVSWYRKAAEQGNSRAQNNLSVMYAHGTGVERSDSQSLYWLKKAAAGGNKKAIAGLAKRGHTVASATASPDQALWVLSESNLKSLVAHYGQSAQNRHDIVQLAVHNLEPIARRSTISNGYRPLRDEMSTRYKLAKTSLSQAELIQYRALLHAAILKINADSNNKMPPFLYNWLKPENLK